jgi:hypothetical protein
MNRRWTSMYRMYGAGAACAGLVLTLALTACGGGGGSGPSGSSSPASAQMGKANVALADAPSLDFDHVWITAKEIDFHQLDTASPMDSQWLKFPLSAPVTIDLTQYANGNLAQVFSGLSLPVGTYRQIRLILVDDEAALTNSALADALLYNDQVDYTDSAGVSRHAPLEIIGPRQGINLMGTFSVSASAPLNLVLDFDVDDDVVRFPDSLGSGLDAFTLKPNLRYFDLAQSGAIVGKVDPTQLAVNGGTAYNLIIKAEQISSDGTHHQVMRATTVRSDGTFTLFPVTVASGMSQNYDVLVRGREMETLIVRGVPVTAGTTPTNGATQISSTPLPITIGSEYTVNLASAMAPTGSWVNFFQTLPPALDPVGVPYEVRFRHVNPFTGLIEIPFPLSEGSLHVGDYVASGSPTFTTAAPVQGAGGFSAFGGAIQFATSASVSTVPPLSGTSTSILVPQLAVASPYVPGQLTVNIATATPGHYTHGELVVSRFGMIVDSLPIDAELANGGQITMPNLPSGTSTTPDRGAYYYAWLRVWNAMSVRPHIVPVLGFADLTTSSSAMLNVTIP